MRPTATRTATRTARAIVAMRVRPDTAREDSKGFAPIGWSPPRFLRPHATVLDTQVANSRARPIQAVVLTELGAWRGCRRTKTKVGRGRRSSSARAVKPRPRPRRHPDVVTRVIAGVPAGYLRDVCIFSMSLGGRAKPPSRGRLLHTRRCDRTRRNSGWSAAGTLDDGEDVPGTRPTKQLTTRHERRDEQSSRRRRRIVRSSESKRHVGRHGTSAVAW